MQVRVKSIASHHTYKTILSWSCMPHAKILIVDDHPANLLVLETILNNQNYTLIRASSGKEAVDLVAKEEFACILLDVQMPIMDGFEAAQRIRQLEKHRRTPIIFVTANYPFESDALRGYEAGAVDYLVKPLNIEVVRAKVAVFVELLLAERENRRQAAQIIELERRQASQAKRLSDSRYQSLVDGIQDGIVWIADCTMSQFLFVSNFAEKITGYPLNLWLTEQSFWSNRIHPDDRERVQTAFQDGLKSQSPFAIEHRFIKSDESVVWLQTSVHINNIEDSLTPEFRGLSVDISHLKSIEEALRSALKARDEFLSIASHELRTPLTPLQLQMQSYLKHIESTRNDELDVNDLRDMLKLSKSQVARLSRLISQLLEISRIDIGRFHLESRDNNIGELIEQVVQQFYYEIKASECSLTLNLERDVIAPVDSLRFEQVIVNLLSNALKYAAGKPVKIQLKKTEHETFILSVADQGIGIAPEDQARIFHRFERAISASHYGGLGLGLYIASQIVKQHNGHIGVKSQLGKETCFSIELPLSVNSQTTNVHWSRNNPANIESTQGSF